MRGAIADDFTGATDLAGNWRSNGLRTAVVPGVPAGNDVDALREYDAVVIALKIRSAPSDVAVSQSLRAAAVLNALGCEQIYDKYCSTFDSTPTGNIGPVADALLGATGANSAVVVPAFPDAGRTVYQGHLFVHDELLAESPMKDHPLNPMWDSRVARLLSSQTSLRVAEVHLPTVRKGVSALTEALQHHAGGGASYIVVDSIDNADLAVIAEATWGDRMVTGGSGLGLAAKHTGAPIPEISDLPGHRAILVGSRSSTTQAQVRAAELRLPSRRLNVRALHDDLDGEVDQIRRWVINSWRQAPGQPVMVHSVLDLQDVDNSIVDQTPALIEKFYAELAPILVQEGTSGMILAGGETSGSVVNSLGITRLEMGQSLGPGVSWTRGLLATGESINLVLKSGNFGDRHLFTAAWEGLV